MDQKEFRKLIKKDLYQVFLFESPIPRPFSFIVHSWIVTNNKGKINRWEVWEFKKQCKTSWGYVHLNLLKPWIGMNKGYLGKGLRFKSRLLGKIEGEKGSVAGKMIKFIEKNAKNYKYSQEYEYVPGPNSNTFIQWIIDKFPKSKFKLGKNALGKGYKLS